MPEFDRSKEHFPCQLEVRSELATGGPGVDSVQSVSVEDGHLYKKVPSFVPRACAEAPPTVCAKARFLKCVAPGVTDDHDSVR